MDNFQEHPGYYDEPTELEKKYKQLQKQSNKQQAKLTAQIKTNDELSLNIARLEGTIQGLEFINKVLKEKDEPKFCICCEEITEENEHLHRNCGK